MLRIQREPIEAAGVPKARTASPNRSDKSVIAGGVEELSSNSVSRQSKLLRQVENEIARLKNAGADVSRAEDSLASARKALEGGDPARAENFASRAGIEARRSSTSQRESAFPEPALSAGGSSESDNGSNTSVKGPRQGPLPPAGLNSLNKAMDEEIQGKEKAESPLKSRASRTNEDEAQSKLDFKGQASLASLDLAARAQTTIDSAVRRSGGNVSADILSHIVRTAGAGSVLKNNDGSYVFSPSRDGSSDYMTPTGSSGYGRSAYLRIGTGENSTTDSLAAIGVTSSPADSFAEISRLASSEQSPQDNAILSDPAISGSEVPTMADLADSAQSTDGTTVATSQTSDTIQEPANQLTEDSSSDSNGKSLGIFKFRGLFRRAFNAYFRSYDSGSFRINFRA